MKKIIIICLCIIMLCSSCNLSGVPEEVTVEGVKYVRIFDKGELWPVEINFFDEENFEEEQWIDIDENVIDDEYYFYYYTKPYTYVYSYDATDMSIYMYIDSTQYDEALEYYSNDDNYVYYCLQGNPYDLENAKVVDVGYIDVDKLEELNTYAMNISDNQISSFQTSADTYSIDIDEETFPKEEIWFLKVSKDGCLSSALEPFVIRDEKLYSVYSYEFSDRKGATATIVEVPSKISDYFIELYNNTMNTEN